jgi:hydroxymethylbilane synthase
MISEGDEFLQEAESSLREGHTDVVVHAMREVPHTLSSEFTIAAILERDNPFDALVSNQHKSLKSLPQGGKIGTPSLRCMSQLKALRNDLAFILLEDSMSTQLERLDRGEFDAVILSACKLAQLGKKSRIGTLLKPFECLPGIGQGALCIEALENNQQVLDLIKTLNHPQTEQCILAERAMSQTLNGGRHIPMAGFAQLEDNQIRLTGLVANPSGKQIIYNEVTGPASRPEALGMELGKKLLKEGAARIINGLNIREGK